MTASQISLVRTNNPRVTGVRTLRYMLFFSYDTRVLLVDTALARIYVNRDRELSKTSVRHVDTLLKNFAGGDNTINVCNRMDFDRVLERASL